MQITVGTNIESSNSDVLQIDKFTVWYSDAASDKSLAVDILDLCHIIYPNHIRFFLNEKSYTWIQSYRQYPRTSLHSNIQNISAITQLSRIQFNIIAFYALHQT